jgi:uncharacterized membrane protein YfcA
MEYLLIICLFIIAVLYSSIGHGGGSGYLALFAIFGIAPLYMKATALALNIFVSSIAFFSYYRAGHFRFRLILPFLITSIPSAYFGALINVNPRVYKFILGIFLLIAIGRMLLVAKATGEASNRPNFYVALFIGAILGFFSGMIGIGGGIILSPLLLLLRWANLKETAAASALFIFLNSAAGLTGVIQSGFTLEPRVIFWILAGIAGAFTGSYIGSFKLDNVRLKYLLSIVLLFASVKLLIF